MSKELIREEQKLQDQLKQLHKKSDGLESKFFQIRKKEADIKKLLKTNAEKQYALEKGIDLHPLRCPYCNGKRKGKQIFYFQLFITDDFILHGRCDACGKLTVISGRLDELKYQFK